MQRTTLCVHWVHAPIDSRVLVEARVTNIPRGHRSEYSGPSSFMVKWNGRWRRVRHHYFTAYFMDGDRFMVVT